MSISPSLEHQLAAQHLTISVHDKDPLNVCKSDFYDMKISCKINDLTFVGIKMYSDPFYLRLEPLRLYHTYQLDGFGVPLVVRGPLYG